MENEEHTSAFPFWWQSKVSFQENKHISMREGSKAVKQADLFLLLLNTKYTDRIDFMFSEDFNHMNKDGFPQLPFPCCSQLADSHPTQQQGPEHRTERPEPTVMDEDYENRTERGLGRAII